MQVFFRVFSFFFFGRAVQMCPHASSIQEDALVLRYIRISINTPVSACVLNTNALALKPRIEVALVLSGSILTLTLYLTTPLQVGDSLHQ